jgi:hypothetical protein
VSLSVTRHFEQGSGSIYINLFPSTPTRLFEQTHLRRVYTTTRQKRMLRSISRIHHTTLHHTQKYHINLRAMSAVSEFVAAAQQAEPKLAGEGPEQAEITKLVGEAEGLSKDLKVGLGLRFDLRWS